MLLRLQLQLWGLNRCQQSENLYENWECQVCLKLSFDYVYTIFYQLGHFFWKIMYRSYLYVIGVKSERNCAAFIFQMSLYEECIIRWEIIIHIKEFSRLNMEESFNVMVDFLISKNETNSISLVIFIWWRIWKSNNSMILESNVASVSMMLCCDFNNFLLNMQVFDTK